MSPHHTCTCRLIIQVLEIELVYEALHRSVWGTIETIFNFNWLGRGFGKIIFAI